jgi:long-chain-fatty-acid---luciferin-component ligase
MGSNNSIRSFIASLPVDKVLTAALNVGYAWTKRRGDYITQLVCHPDYGRMSIEDLKDLQMKAIKQAFEHHYKNCEAYRYICKDLIEIKNFEDIWSIPQIHAEEFKKGGIISVSKDQIYTVVTTSGTSGSASSLPKDITSQLRLGIEIIRLILNVYYPLAAEYTGRTLAEARRYALNNWTVNIFSPPPTESSSLMVKAFEPLLPIARILGIDVNFFLPNYEFDPKRVFEEMRGINQEKKMMLFLGFHYAFNRIMDYMDEMGERVELDPTGENMCVVIIGGGWKTLTGEKIKKNEFEKRLKDHFGLDDLFITEAYGFGEANFGIFNLCPDKKYHVVLPVPVRTRDPETLELQDYGEKGLISVWDPTMNSYPAFVITDDIGRVSDYHECPACGFVGQDLELVGRLSKAEMRSCGLKIQQNLRGEDKKKGVDPHKRKDL